MLEKFYQDTLAYIRKDHIRFVICTFFTKYSPLIDIMIYPLLLGYLYYKDDIRLFKCIWIPAISFLICTIIRKIYNAPRPYELYSYEPLASHSIGESFPSRHTLSAFAIGYCCLYISLPLGIFTLIIALFVGISRLIAGLHFPKDVLAGFLLATFLSIFYCI